MLEEIVAFIKQSLDDDIVSYCEMGQIVEDVSGKKLDESVSTKELLHELLSSNVEIGHAIAVKGNYVKYVAWKGDVTSRVERAIKEIQSSAECDKEFCFWLCHKRNIDEYEEDKGRWHL